jgi:hypothetical protein
MTPNTHIHDRSLSMLWYRHFNKNDGVTPALLAKILLSGIMLSHKCLLHAIKMQASHITRLTAMQHL